MDSDTRRGTRVLLRTDKLKAGFRSKTNMKAFTDYPILELGDKPNQEAPIRECDVLSYDGDKYCEIRVSGCLIEVKTGYLYTEKGRCGDAPLIDVKLISAQG